MMFDDKPGNVDHFRQATTANKPLNLPNMTTRRFCGQQEYRGCMKLNRCRACYGRTA